MPRERENLSRMVETLLAEIEAIVDRKVEEKLPEMIRALGIAEAVPDDEYTELVSAVEVAKLLGRDVSTPENVLRAKQHVYNLARQNLIPSVRVSPRCLRFDLDKVKQVLARGGSAQPHSKAA